MKRQRSLTAHQQLRLCGVERDLTLMIFEKYSLSFHVPTVNIINGKSEQFDRADPQINADLIMLFMAYKRSLLDPPATKKFLHFFYFFSGHEVSVTTFNKKYRKSVAPAIEHEIFLR